MVLLIEWLIAHLCVHPIEFSIKCNLVKNSSSVLLKKFKVVRGGVLSLIFIDLINY